MAVKVKKRNGKLQDFNSEKIYNAILGAVKDVSEEVNLDIVKRIVKDISEYVQNLDKDFVTIEEIQDLVEDKLMNSSLKNVAKQYIKYRYNRERVRDSKFALMAKVKEKLFATNVENQNANLDERSFSGRANEAFRVIAKEYALDNCMSEMARENHLNNEIYIHDLDSYATGMHNCCSRDTKFITDTGVWSFEDFNDGDIINVLTHDGNFKPAKIKSFGKQMLNKITFVRAGQRYAEEKFTANHRWLLADGTETANLKVGDVVLKAPDLNREFTFEEANEKEKYYWCLGFVLGDGTNAYRWSHGKKNPDIKFVRLRLCGDKTKYAERFNILKHSVKEMDNGDLYLTFSSTINFIKEFPELDAMSHNEKLALFDGLYCADGQQTGQRKSLFTSNEQIASFIEDIAPSLGYYILQTEDFSGQKTNYGIRGFAKNFIFSGDNNKYYWIVSDIQPDKEEEVWCLEVKDNHSFVLPNGIVTGNCLSIPLDDLLANGFKTKQCTVRPAQSVSSALQLIAVIMQLQSLQQFGGVSATHLDWTMVPYVKKSFKKHYVDGLAYIDEWEPAKDKGVAEKMLNFEIEMSNKDCQEYCPEAYTYAIDMTKKEVYQGVESLFHNLNTLQSRSGQQLPFSSINYGTCTLPEGRMVIKALLDVSIAGVGKLHTTPIFPCGIFQCMKGVNRKEGDPNYDLFKLALKSTSLRLYPNYCNVDWSNNAGYDINDPKTYMSTMGCRTSNGLDINADKGVNPQTKDGRGNICPVTIILPTLAMEANRNVEKFMSLLDKKIHEAKDMLLERYEWICSQPWESARFMYENNTMLGFDGKDIRSALRHGTIVIGQLGLAETLQILIGKDHTTDEGMKLAKQIEQLFKDRCAEFKQKYKLNFGVYYTPAETLCYTALEKFKEKYGVIENVSDKEFFTNSMHVPVWHELTPFEKIDIESQLTGYSNAGCITYVELESGAKYNIEALEELVNYAMDKDIPYFAINLPNDTCNDCGFTGEFNDECPMCHSKNITQLRRVTGYLTADYKTTFNQGKVDEVEHRVKHNRIIH